MKIAVVGLGSMGKRRIRLLKKLNKTVQIFGIESNMNRAEAVHKEFSLEAVYSNIDQLIKENNIDAIIVSSSPLTHKDYILKALDNNFHTFSEINLTDEKYDEIISTSKEKERIAFLSSTFLYRKEIEWIKKHIKPEESFYRYHIGQYLPDWHPWESYKDFFVKDRRTNGCREIMAIEFPWLLGVFGDVKDFKVIKSKKTKLELNYPDVYQILFEHKTGATGSITIDLVSRKTERSLQIISENAQIEWRGTPETLFDYDIENHKTKKIVLYEDISREEGYAGNIIENAYEEELRLFLKSMEQNENLGLYDYKKDQKVLNLINRIEENSDE